MTGITTAGYPSLGFCGWSWRRPTPACRVRQTVGDSAAVETGGELAVAGIDIFNVANVPVIQHLVVVVLDLHDLVARRKGPAEPLDLMLSGGVQRRLQFDVERACADAAPVHGAQNLDVANGIEAEARGDPCLDQLYDRGTAIAGSSADTK